MEIEDAKTEVPNHSGDNDELQDMPDWSACVMGGLDEGGIIMA